MWESIWESLPFLLQGMTINVLLLLGIIAVGITAGLGVAMLQVYGHWALSGVAIGYAWFFRGVPELVLLMLVYFGLNQFGIRISPFLAAVAALGLRSSAYQSQIFRGAIQAVHPGQSLAARSIGMTKLQMIFRVILPQAVRFSIAPWSNEFTSVFKDTTLAYAIGVIEILRRARYLVARDFALTIPALITVAVIFFVFVSAGNRGLQALETKLYIPGFESKQVSRRA